MNVSPDRAVSVHTTKHLFSAVKTVLEGLLKDRKSPARILDAPAGAGALTKYLVETFGADVVPLEIDPSKWEYDASKPVVHDLSQPLAFETASFDVVVCLEGLKHIGNVSYCISEMSRVLKPDGFLIVTLPNDLCLQSRLRYLFDGFVDTDWIHPMDPKSINETRFFHLNSIVSLPYLYYFLSKSGLVYLNSHTSRYRGWSVLFGLILFPVIALTTFRSSLKNHPLGRELRSFVWLAGRHNIVVAQKKALAKL